VLALLLAFFVSPFGDPGSQARGQSSLPGATEESRPAEPGASSPPPETPQPGPPPGQPFL